MVYLILLGLTFFTQLFTASWYILTEWKIGKKKAMRFKMLCCGTFILDAVLCAAIRQSFTSRSFLFILAALLCCTVGDVLLNLDFKSAFAAGIGCFCLGHSIYAALFSAILAGRYLVPFFNTVDIICWCVLLGAFAALTFRKKLFDFKGMRAAVITYASIILIMAVKAVHLGVLAQASGIPENQSLSFGLIIGSLGFIISDAILLMMYFGNKNTRKNSMINAFTYFYAQMILACTLLYIGG